MNINRNNYEAFALDYLEGRLTPVGMASFMAFLTENPDIANELELLSIDQTNSIGSPENIDFSYLKKDVSTLAITDATFEEICISWHEGDLKSSFIKKINEYNSVNPDKKKIFESYGKLKLEPDFTVNFRNKSSLKKPITLIPFRRAMLIASLSAAASLAVFFIATDQKENISPSVVQNITTPITSKTTPSEPNQKLKLSKINSSKPKFHKKKRLKNENIFNHIAVVDTNKPPLFNLANLKRIESGNIEIEPSHPEELIAFNPQLKPKISKEALAIEKVKTKGTDFYLKASNLTVDNLISSSINGINKMAETNLIYQSKSDINGKIKEFALSSESFNFKRIVGRN